MAKWEDAPQGWEQNLQSRKWEDAPVKAPPSFIQRVAENVAGPIEGAYSLGTGMVAAPAAGLAGAVGTVLPGPAGQGADYVRRVQDALTYEPRTDVGKTATHIVAAPFEALAGVADKAGGATTDLASNVLPPAGAAALGAGVNTLIQAAPMAIGKVAPKVAAAVPKAPINPALAQAAGAGFKFTPEEAGAGIGSKTAASLSGEPRLARKISNENASIATDKIAQDLGLAKGDELSHDALEAIREKQGAAYETLRKAGTVQIDQPFMNDLREIVNDWQGAAKDFPRKQNPVMEVYRRLTENPDGSIKRSFDANSAVSEIKNLRTDAQEAFADRKFELGRANLDAASALENVLDRHIGKASAGSDGAGVPGNTDAVAKFRDARKLIAKTYDAEKALGPQGTINPQVYAKLLEKGKPLSGGSMEVAQAARNFPRSMQKPSSMGTGPTFADAAMAVLSGGKELPLLFARPVARSIIASSPYQNMFIRNPGSLAEALAGSGDALPIGAYAGQSNAKK